ncbi:MAG: biotin/lipoyl-binding protein, partial [Bacteroidaceae bacterium]|nr:biotin/lipoyl-binding protein [Bacteroidaceae bacterium]
MKKLLFAVALLSITACHKKSEPVPNSAALPIEVATPIVREITLTREYPGYLKADATIPIMGRVNGSIIKRNFTEGSRVKKGDLLYVIEPTL